MTCKVQYENGTLSTDDKDAIAAEVSQLGTEIKRHRRRRPKFNGTALLDGSGTFTFQVGANDRRDRSPRRGFNLSAAPPAARPPIVAARRAPRRSAGVSALDARRRSTTAIKNVSTARADFGAVQNRLEHRLNNLATYQENLTASESRIRDVDMAAEMVKFTKLRSCSRPARACSRRPTRRPQGVLSLLR